MCLEVCSRKPNTCLEIVRAHHRSPASCCLTLHHHYAAVVIMATPVLTFVIVGHKDHPIFDIDLVNKSPEAAV